MRGRRARGCEVMGLGRHARERACVYVCVCAGTPHAGVQSGRAHQGHVCRHAWCMRRPQCAQLLLQPCCMLTGLVARLLCRCALHTGHSLSSPCLRGTHGAHAPSHSLAHASHCCIDCRRLLTRHTPQRSAARQQQGKHASKPAPAGHLGAQVLLDAARAVAVQADHADARAADLACGSACACACSCVGACVGGRVKLGPCLGPLNVCVCQQQHPSPVTSSRPCARAPHQSTWGSASPP